MIIININDIILLIFNMVWLIIFYKNIYRYMIKYIKIDKYNYVWRFWNFYMKIILKKYIGMLFVDWFVDGFFCFVYIIVIDILLFIVG